MLAALSLVTVVRAGVGHPMLVRGHSMKPTVLDGELVWLDVHERPVRLGDVVAVEHPAEGMLLKRVVGLPGDSIEIRDGALVRNGSPVPVRRLGRSENWKDAEQVLPLEWLFVDRFAEDLGGVHLIQRFAESHPMPAMLVPADGVFLLGDNRGDSVDSRAFGPVPLSRIVGRVHLRPRALD